MASQNLRWSSADAPILVNRSPAVVFHQSANPLLNTGPPPGSAPPASDRPQASAAGPARPAHAGRSARPRPGRPTGPTPPRRAPKARCRVRSGSTAASRASNSASISAAVPRYRSDTIFGLPSTRAICAGTVRLPLITFLVQTRHKFRSSLIVINIQAPNPVCHRKNSARRDQQSHGSP